MEDYYAHRNSSHRFVIQKVDDSGEIQLVDANGLTDEQHTKIMRVYPHGFSSNSMQDSHMLSLGLGGRRDMTVALGGEHKDHRPKNLPSGDTILYNAEGDAIRFFGKKTLDITHSKNIKISIGQGLATSQSSSTSSSGASGSTGGSTGGDSNPGKEASAGPDKDVTMVFTENDITVTKGKSVIKLDANNVTLTQGGSSIQITDQQITVTTQHFLVNSPKTDLGGEGGGAVGTCEGGCSTKVFAVV